ncbi:MAG: polyprenyl synthetase family protein [Leptospiraceae bacterium]|nr:polyprenyl synthetase family protein [Leptospiraceae bacterium]MDW7975585.1 polyprenyl synthetase family protein [Leptospiraceae bacterium]
MKENYYLDLTQKEKIQKTLSFLQSKVDAFLAKEISDFVKKESHYVYEVYEPILYSLLGGGKRFRSVLFLLFSDYHDSLSNDEKFDLLLTSSSIELIHTYTLIHDDLPAMDNDELRRGKPTCHRAFNEWAAILAGDALNTLAFYLLSKTKKNPIEKIQVLSRFAGIHGIILGQALDLSSEKKDFPHSFRGYEQLLSVIKEKNYYFLLENFLSYSNALQVILIHYHKTALLFRAVGEMALYSSDIYQNIVLDEKRKQPYIEYCELLGLLFQITDDLLDELGIEEEVGKKVKKDQQIGKLTFPSVFGSEITLQIAKSLAKRCSDYVEEFSIRPQEDFTTTLRYLPFFLLERKS